MAETALWLTEADVTATVGLGDAVDAVRAALVAEHGGRAATMAKTALAWDGGHTLHALGGVDHATGLVATKTLGAHRRWGAARSRRVGQRDRTAAGDDRGVRPRAAAHRVGVGGGDRRAGRRRTRPCWRSSAPASRHSPRWPPRSTAGRSPRCGCSARRPIIAHRSPSGCVRRSVRAVVVCDGVDAAHRRRRHRRHRHRARHPVLDAGMLGGRTLVVAVGAITPERAELDGAVAASATLVVSDSPATARQVVPRARRGGHGRRPVGRRRRGDRRAGRRSPGVQGDGARTRRSRRRRRGACADAVLDGRGTPIADRRRSEPRWFRGGST